MLDVLIGCFTISQRDGEADYVVDRAKQSVTEPAPTTLYSAPKKASEPPPATLYTEPKERADIRKY
jgi:hypothetical protein